MEDRVLTDALRRRLQRPLGTLIVESPAHSMQHLGRLFQERKPKKIIAVGDFVSKKIYEAGLGANLYIVDNKIRRRAIEPLSIATDVVLETSNPPGTISRQSHEVVKKALKIEGTSKIVVTGEEDLLTLLAILYSPNGSLIIYGQPKKGLVIVETDKIRKTEAKKMIESMIKVKPKAEVSS
jgi:uncharacterized protein (UPF0218 family)